MKYKKIFPRRIWLSVPHVAGSEQRIIEDTFHSNWLSTVGPNLSALEAEFGALTRIPALAVSSGTAALHLAVRLLGIGPGDEVVMPTLTFVACANVVRYQQGIPVFIDSQTDHWGIASPLLAEFLKRRANQNRLPKAVLIAHLFGQAVDLDSIQAACERYGIPLIEDAAHALGTHYRGQQVGTRGAIGVFSLGGNKIITATCGGILVSSNREWVNKARYWSTQARDPDPLNLGNYVHSELGYNYRLSNVLAGIARGQLEVLELRVQQRRAVFERYRQAFADLPGIEPQPEADFTEKLKAEIGKAESGKIQIGKWKVESGNINQGQENSEDKTENTQHPTLKRGIDQDSATRSSDSQPAFSGSRHTRWLSCFLIDEKQFGMSAGDLIRFLEAANVESRPVWKPMHTQKLYQGYECVGGQVAEDLNRRGICLPSSSCLTDDEQQFVIDRVREAAQR